MEGAPAAAGERTILASPFPAAGGRVLVSPFQFLVTGEDNLRIEGWNSASNVALAVAYRFADTKGRIVANEIILPLTSDRVVAELDVKLGEGYLVNMSVFVRGGESLIGQTFCCIKLIRGLTGATMVLGLLAQGYITHEQGLGWPGSPIERSDSGQGALRVVNGTDPAAGVEITETVPTGARWELVSFLASLQNNANATTRQPALIFDNGTNTFTLSRSSLVGVANDYRTHGWAQGLPLDAAIGSGAQIAGLVTNTALRAGFRIRTQTNGFQAGDNWETPFYIVREWLEGG